MRTELTSQRLIARVPRPSDADFLFTIYSDDEVMRFQPQGSHIFQSETEAMLRQWLNDDWGQTGIGYYLVERKADHQPVGYAGLAFRELASKPVLNMAYALAKAAWGHGYTAEIMPVIMAEYQNDERLCHIPITGTVDQANQHSIDILPKISMYEFTLPDQQSGTSYYSPWPAERLARYFAQPTA